MIIGKEDWFDKDYLSLIETEGKIVSTVCDAGQRQIRSSKTGQIHEHGEIKFIANQIYI